MARIVVCDFRILCTTIANLSAVQAAAEDIPITLFTVVPSKGTGKAEYMARFPMSRGKIPGLEGKGVKLTETLAITTVRRV